MLDRPRPSQSPSLIEPRSDTGRVGCTSKDIGYLRRHRKFLARIFRYQRNRGPAFHLRNVKAELKVTAGAFGFGACVRCPGTRRRRALCSRAEREWPLIAAGWVRTVGDPRACYRHDRLKPELAEVSPRCRENLPGPVQQFLCQSTPAAVLSRTCKPTIGFCVIGRISEQASAGESEQSGVGQSPWERDLA